MATIRLNSAQRYQIARRAVAEGFKKEDGACAKREAKLVRACHAALFPPAIRKAAAAAPKGWIGTSCDFLFNAAGESIRLKADEPLLVPASHCYSYSYFLKDAALVTQVRELARAKEILRARKKEAANALNSMLASVSSTKRLSKIWPEGRAFYKDVVVSPVALPALHVGEINKLLNLKAAQGKFIASPQHKWSERK